MHACACVCGCVRQAQSKEKVLAKMMAGGLTEKVVKEKKMNFKFPNCGQVRVTVKRARGPVPGYGDICVLIILAPFLCRGAKKGGF